MTDGPVANVLKTAFNLRTVSPQESEDFLTSALEGDNAGITRFLGKHPEAIDIRSEFEQTALIYAARSGHRKTVELLLEHGASPEAEDKHGLTAAIYAENHGYREIMEAFRQWPEKKIRLEAARHARFLEETDCSKGLQRELPVREPFKFPSR